MQNLCGEALTRRAVKIQTRSPAVIVLKKRKETIYIYGESEGRAPANGSDSSLFASGAASTPRRASPPCHARARRAHAAALLHLTPVLRLPHNRSHRSLADGLRCSPASLPAQPHRPMPRATAANLDVMRLAAQHRERKCVSLSSRWWRGYILPRAVSRTMSRPRAILRQ
jgi:hypothetical protein